MWAVTILCLLGTVANVFKKRICFYLWAVGNIAWLIYDLSMGLYSRAVLDAVQLVLAIVGIFTWKKSNLKEQKNNENFNHKRKL
jgi:nicotinamide riboside transporter PnuC